MADLDEQLRAYADRVEARVGPTPTLRRAGHRRRRGLGWAVALFLAVAVGAAIGFALDDETTPDTRVQPDPPLSVPTLPPSTDPPAPDPERVSVPDVSGMTLVQALTMLHDADLRIAGEPAPEASELDETRVTRTDPPGGRRVARGTEVAVFVSGGPAVVPVPVVVGLFADTALATLRNVGLEPVTEFRLVPAGDPQVGIVIDQSPPGFAAVAVGSEVVIVVGEAGPDPTTTTTVPD